MEIDPKDALTPADPAPEVVPEPPAQPAVNPGPWAKDLERFPEEIRSDVDAYLRETWQPRVTQLEQRPDLPDNAAQLWNDLNSEDKYAQAFLALTGDLFDDDVQQEVLTLLTKHYSEAPPTEEQPPKEEPPAQQRDPEVQALIDERHQDAYNKAVDAAVAEQKDEAGNVTVPAIPEAFRDLLHPIVVQLDGDVEAGARVLREKLTTAGVLGSSPAEEAPPEPPPATATVPTPPAVPTQPSQSLEEAISDFWREQQSVAPPPVGSV